MRKPSFGRSAGQSVGPSREPGDHASLGAFPEFCRRLFELSAGDPGNWIASAHVDSTNSQARRWLARCRGEGMSLRAPTCFLAWEQSAGRGRGGRKWSSAAGLGLYMTVMESELSSQQVQQLPLISAAVVARSVSVLLGGRVRVKWPNDILVGERKLAGILVEVSSRGATAATALIGIGINVRHTAKTLPLSSATSLLVEGVPRVDMALLAFRIVGALHEALAAESTMAEVVTEYRLWSKYEPGDQLCCRVGDDSIEGEFAGFADDGCLLLDCGARIVKLRSSEIVEA